jgi:cyclic beta-1,2-glucan synthetase
MYQTAIEGVLGLRRGDGVFSIDPAIPAMWPRYSIDWKVGATRYRITVLNPEHQCRGVRSAEIDGVVAEPQAIPLRDDGKTHDVLIVLGKPSTPVLHGGPVSSTEREGR